MGALSYPYAEAGLLFNAVLKLWTVVPLIPGDGFKLYRCKAAVVGVQGARTRPKRSAFFARCRVESRKSSKLDVLLKKDNKHFKHRSGGLYFKRPGSRGTVPFAGVFCRKCVK
jgi:hypothetical protein